MQLPDESGGGPRTAAAALNPRELARYSRHLLLPEVGLAGQLRLREASVLLAGVGGLGSPCALYLAAAGVGRIGLVDFDRVELSNLQRQVLYGTHDVGRSKLDVARDRLAETNPHVAVELHETRLGAANARRIFAGYDVVIDGTDNFETRYLVNDACVMLGKPNVYGSIFRFEGQVAVFLPGAGPCYRCLYPEPPAPGRVPNCAEGGVLGILPGVVGALQATEALKLLLGKGDPLVGRLLLFDALEMRFRELRILRDRACPLCGDHPTIHELRESTLSCGTAGLQEGPADPGFDSVEISPRELRERQSAGDWPTLLDVRTAEEWAICRLDGARLIPLADLAERLGDLDPQQEIVVYCHVGGRSTIAVGLLRARGFNRALNLTGGIDAWAAAVDPALPRY